MRQKAIIFIIIALIFAGLFLRYSHRAPKRHYSDFRVYYATGQRFLGREDIYARPDESITPFKYSPIFAVMIAPLSVFPQFTSSLIFFTINFGLLIIAFVFSKKLITQNEISFRESIFLYSIVAVLNFRFILRTLDSGQVGIIMFALVVLGLYLLEKNKDAIGSAFLGLSIMIKYTPFVFLPYFLFRKKIKIIFLVIIFIVIYCFIPAIYAGLDTGLNYVKNWLPSIIKTSFYVDSWFSNKNQSLFSLMLRYFTDFEFNQVLAAAFVIGAIIYLLIILPGKNYAFEKPIDYSLLFISMALFNPDAYIHNFVVFIFVYMTLFYYLMKIKFKDRFILILVILSFVLTTLTSELFVGDKLETLFEKLSLTTIASLILVFLLFRLKWFPTCARSKLWRKSAYQ